MDLSLSQSCFQSNMSVITVVIRHILRAVPGHQSSQRHGCEIVLCQSSSDRNQSQHTLDSDTVDPLLEPSHIHCTLEGEREEGGGKKRGRREEKREEGGKQGGGRREEGGKEGGGRIERREVGRRKREEGGKEGRRKRERKGRRKEKERREGPREGRRKGKYHFQP